MARKTPVQVNLAYDGQQWVGQGGRVSVKGPTLRAAKQRVRMAVEEVYGAEVEFSVTLQLPGALRGRVEAYRKKQEELERMRAEVRDETVELVETLRIKLGFGNTDSAELLNVDPSTLTRLMSTTTRFKLE